MVSISMVQAGGTLALAALLYLLFDPMVTAMIDVPDQHGQTEYAVMFVSHLTSIWTWFLLAAIGFFVVWLIADAVFQSGRGI